MPNRKLKLKADVLRHLTEQETRRVAGGTDATECATCDDPTCGYPTCNGTCNDTCGQNTCGGCGSVAFCGSGTCYNSCAYTCGITCNAGPSYCGCSYNYSACEGWC
jgi:hypothetical protein